MSNTNQENVSSLKNTRTQIKKQVSISSENFVMCKITDF